MSHAVTDHHTNLDQAEQALEPCPFCGGRPTSADFDMISNAGEYWHWAVSCQNRSCLVEIFAYGDNREAAEVAWNTRPLPPDQASE